MSQSPYRTSMRLTGFELVRPPYEVSQADALAWLARVHAASARAASDHPLTFDEEGFRAQIDRLLNRVGCASSKVASRGHEVADVARGRWDEMHIYDVSRHPDGAGAGARTAAYLRAAEAAVDRLYERVDTPPTDLIHVTCTGYTSPSAAQRLVSKRGWGNATRVTHAYHMGCYAALPAVRVAVGLLASGRASGRPPRADIVHTEICSLHLHPADHSLEQLVVQSLFADGHIRYSVERGQSRLPNASGLALVAAREVIVPDSTDAMTWVVSDTGMAMTLARDVPSRIARGTREFVASLYEEAKLDFPRDLARTVFAVHPGGPKIIDAVQQALELSEPQVAASREVLFHFGNMSSATLPHVWLKLASDPDVRAGTPIVSLAFGPGLTMCGSLMIKE